MKRLMSVLKSHFLLEAHDENDKERADKNLFLFTVNKIFFSLFPK